MSTLLRVSLCRNERSRGTCGCRRVMWWELAGAWSRQSLGGELCQRFCSGWRQWSQLGNGLAALWIPAKVGMTGYAKVSARE